MNAPHFKELIETICISTNSTKVHVASVLNVHPYRINCWQRRGLPRTKAPLVVARLRKFLFENIGG